MTRWLWLRAMRWACQTFDVAPRPWTNTTGGPSPWVSTWMSRPLITGIVDTRLAGRGDHPPASPPGEDCLGPPEVGEAEPPEGELFAQRERGQEYWTQQLARREDFGVD